MQLRSAAITCALFLSVFTTQFVSADTSSPLLGDALQPPPPRQATRGVGSATPDRYTPSAFLAGNVAVRLVFVESDGSKQPSTEDWSDSQRTTVEQQVRAALDWWAARVPNAHVHFQVVVQTAATGYEPISLTLSDEGRWAGDSFSSLGFSGTSYFEQAYSANAALRAQYHSDWATTIFVVNSVNDTDGRFADGHFAYAYVGGPFLVVTSDAGMYGTNKLAPVVSHEFGHIFGALDQYASAKTPCSTPGGYLAVQTTNSQADGCGSKFICVMLEPLAAYTANAVDASALGQVGYRDSNNNGVPDPLDTTPTLTVNLSQQHGERPVVTAHAIDQPFPSSSQPSVSINTIQQIEYRVDGSEWYSLPANDGAFDSTDESATATLPLYDGTHSLEFRAVNRIGASSLIVSQTVSLHDVGPAPAYTIQVAEAQNTNAPTVAITAPPDYSVRISESPVFTDTTWQAVTQPFAPAAVWAEGKHTLYIGLRDAQQRETPISQRPVIIDRTAPHGSVTLIDTAQPQLVVTGEDNGSGIVGLQLVGIASTAAWQAFAPSITLAPGSTPSAIRLRDAAGNVSAAIPVAQQYTVLLPLMQSP